MFAPDCEEQVSDLRESPRMGVDDVIDRLDDLVGAHEKKYGPGLPGHDLSKAWVVSLSPEQEAWQSSRELLVGMRVLRKDLLKGEVSNDHENS
jgi:hypothetical protein